MNASWCPCDERLPMGEHDVLCTDLEFIWIGQWDGRAGDWRRDDGPVDVVVTHWMELPEIPEG